MPLTSELRQSDYIRGCVDGTRNTIDARALVQGTAADKAAVITQIRVACLETGFFYLDHVFDQSTVIRDLLSQMENFFALPGDDPRKQAVNNQNKPGTYGWMPIFGEPAYQPGTIAHLESFDCGRDTSDAKRLEGENVWPDIKGFRHDTLAYWDAVTQLGNAVLAAISEAAGLRPEFLPSHCSSQELNTMRLLHYPENDGPANDVNVGIAAHTDFECITLILQTWPGLELTDVNGNWFDAPAHDGRIVVLLDDMLERWTNGFFKATGHRVRNTRWERYSVVMFFAVNSDVTIAPLPQFVSKENLASYAGVRQREHIDNEIRRAELNRADR